MIKKSEYISFLLFILCIGTCYAQQGKDGAKVIGAANVIVNEYTSLTTDANSGNTFIRVINSSINGNNRFSEPLSAGDLIMIIQMQGASINGTPNDSTWGAITNYNNCGFYEFSEVVSVPNDTTINIDCSLKNSYTASGKTQIVRVPRYISLTINAGDTLTCDAWDGMNGGIVAIEVQGNTVIDTGGAINVTGTGFRGGALYNVTTTFFGRIANFKSMNPDTGAQKGEGIAGYLSDYNVYGGMNSRGAPANGGGGGNDHNAGGGGGANAGTINNWTGNGNPDISNPSWASAWNLEYAGFANSVSSGGGRGGYTASQAEANPYTDPPGDAVWGYDDRENVGGKGGRSLDYSGGRIFFGGGGGAGHENNNSGGAGGNGGGLVYILSYGSVSGGGEIIANGGPGNMNLFAQVDGSGGGGSGGTVIVNSIDTINNISIYANGGGGGSEGDIDDPEAEGPGGGGGGGYIAISNGAVIRQANGGASGITNSISLTAFPPNGATKGGSGLMNETISGVPFSSLTVNVSGDVSVCSGTNTILSASGGTTYSWSPAAGLSCTNCSNPVANPSVTTTYIVNVSNGSCSNSDSVVVAISKSAAAGVITAVKDTICQGTVAHLMLNGNSGGYIWQSSSNSATGFTTISGATSTNYATQPLTKTTYYRVIAGTGSCADTSTFTENVIPSPVAAFSVSISGHEATFNSDSSIGASNYTWDFGDGTAISNQTNPTHTYDSAGTYHVCLTLENNSNCTFTLCKNVSIFPTGISEVITSKGWQVYPDPFHDQIFLATEIAGIKVETIQIYDLLGQEAFLQYNNNGSENPIMLDVSDLTEGMYYLVIKTGNGNYIQPIIKQ